MTLEEIIADLVKSDKPLRHTSLAELSSLSAQELKLFRQVWTATESRRRHQIISRLVELVKDNVELNFG